VATTLIFNPLVNSKFDNVELAKAIDVEVTELMPKANKLKKNLIVKDIYDAEVQIQKDLQTELENLNSSIPLLNLEIDNLQIQLDKEINEKLKIEQTQDVLQNQLNTLTDLIELYSTEIAQVVQKSTDESILRTSLESQNAGFKAQIEALIKQIETSYAIINGLLNQIGTQLQITTTTAYPTTPGGFRDGNTYPGAQPVEELKKYK
jgi:chromosome segregation ATPase